MGKDIKSRLSGEYLDIYNRLLMPVDSNIRLESVMLSPENKFKLDNFVEEIENREKLERSKFRPMNRILIYGDSGCGKTYMTKALSNYLDIPLLYVDIASSLVEDVAARNISEIFKLAKHIKTCIVFFDECDSIVWSRDSNSADNGNIRRATNSMLQQLDQMANETIFVAATNMLHRIDPAFERRFELKMKFIKPGSEQLKRVINNTIMEHDFVVIDDVSDEYRNIVERRQRLSVYEIQKAVEKVLKRQILKDKKVTGSADIYKEIADTCNMKIAFGLNESTDKGEIIK